MAKNPFGGSKAASDTPASRRLDLEAKICDAVDKQVLIRVMYKDDTTSRLVEPYGVYRSTKDKYNLACTQIDNPGKPLDKWEPRNLEVGLMRSVAVTDTKFKPDPRFDPNDARYQNGFVCRIK